MKYYILKLTVAIAFGFACWTLFAESHLQSNYLAKMPRQPFGDRTLLLHVQHGHKVFVNEDEYRKYQKYQMLIVVGGAFGSAAVALNMYLYKVKKKEKSKAPL